MKKVLRVLLVWCVLIGLSSEILFRVYADNFKSSPLPDGMIASGNPVLPDGLYSGVLKLEPGYVGIAKTGIEYRVNAQGYRDDEWQHDKDIWVCLGDSTTFGLNIAHADTYAERLERLAPPSVQVLNVAVPGWGTAEELTALNELLSQGVLPEYVVLGFFANDAHNVMVYEARQTQTNRVRGLLEHSYIFRTIYAYSDHQAVKDAMSEEWRDNVSGADVWQRPEWQLTQTYLNRIVDLTRAHNIRLVLLYIPWNEQEVISGYSAVGDALAGYAKQQDILYVNGVTVYHAGLAGQTTVPETFYSSPGDMGHPSALTSGWLAQTIYEAMQ